MELHDRSREVWPTHRRTIQPLPDGTGYALQGYGVTVHLIGSTFISKAGITSSTFKQVPDVPVGTFELTLPQGKYSALAANGNLCTTTKLTMPTSFVAQNGTVIKTTTPITPTGCAKKKAHKTGKHGKGPKHGKK